MKYKLHYGWCTGRRFTAATCTTTATPHEIFIPKGITLYWSRPSGVTNADISLALFVSGICQNPFRRSTLVAYFACPMLSMQSSIRGLGNECFRDRIYFTIVCSHTKCSIRFWYKNTRRTPVTFAWFNKDIVQQILNFFPEILLCRVHCIWMLFDRLWTVNINIIKDFVSPGWNVRK